jgi:hypothetical protein
MEIIFEGKVKATTMSENGVREFMKMMVAKYALTDQEILQENQLMPFEKKHSLISVNRSNSSLNDRLSIEFSFRSADITIETTLI